MFQCKVCGEWCFSTDLTGKSKHQCKPQWLCYEINEESEEEARTIRGIDAEDAAEEYAEWLENNDADCDEYKICVKPLDNPEVAWQLFNVRATTVREYNAKLIEGDEDVSA
jgi:hypothetical protein